MTVASAAWRNAVRVRSSQPLAASCGNSRIGSGRAARAAGDHQAAMQHDVADEQRRRQQR